ncbi:DUF1802 family protein [Tumidithrix elongata RA019]|uniref:DUF1802 family protein n=1 Tax=Tumidithrix elongata BACA0141 TaxID=2716417 RepID=A0AAW9Q2A9_9CYAN|nr:DUF1802 family protein [Tumidithrix elongata RA019]
MANTIIFNALRLPEANVKSLILGSAIAIIPPEFLEPERQFALYPESNLETVKIEAWAKCEDCKMLDKTASLDVIALHTGHLLEFLQASLEKSGNIFLAYLRVYSLPKAIEITSQSMGYYVYFANAIYIDDLLPVVSDRDFEVQKQRLLNREPPESMFEKIERTLKETELQRKIESSGELDWIERIAKIGNSSGGHEFEKLVRKSFIKLGFSNSNTNPKASLDPEATGGAGGIDLCCEYPYPVVGECKASANQEIPTKVCSQLTYLGQAHSPDYEMAIKIIIAAGSLNHHSNPIAIGNKMNVIRPEALEKLVKLKASHTGSINLWELKSCLESQPFGEDADSKLLDFIEKAEGEIKLRSHIVQTVKMCLEKFNSSSVDLDALSGAYHFSNPPKNLSKEELRDILIELSSPLAGYLGRVDENERKCDRFYFLRDLPCDVFS